MGTTQRTPCGKLNAGALHVAHKLVEQRESLGVRVLNIAGAQVVDAGIEAPGGIGAGLLLSRACMANLANITIQQGRVGDIANPVVAVYTDQPVAACMASQYAGWQIKTDDFFGMGSGPMRAAYGKEPLFDDIGCRESSTAIVGILEAGTMPTDAAVVMIAEKTNVNATRLHLLVAPTASLAGGVQIVARSVETAMHKLHELGMDLSRVITGFGAAPLPPVAKDDMKAIGRTNDAILYGAEVTLYVTGDDDSLADLAGKAPASASRDYGEPFGDIFKRFDYDFYKIDPMLFSPAAVTLQNIETGRTHTAGKVNHDVLGRSFFN